MSPSVTLLHGFMGSPAGWSAVSSQLPRSARVTAPWIGGHGPRPSSPPASFDAEVERLADLVAAQPPPRVLSGYSLGGRLALGLATRFPRLADALVLIGASPGLSNEEIRAERRAADDRWARSLERDGISSFAHAWEALPLFASQRQLADAVRRARAEERRSHEPLALAQVLRALSPGRMPDLWPSLPRLAVPTWLLAGHLDSKFAALARELGTSVPDSRVVIVPDAGHDVVLERPAAVACALGEALERVSLAAGPIRNERAGPS